MSSNGTEVPRSSREAARVGWIVLFALVALLPLTVWKNVSEPDTPEEVVSAFFEAVRDGDIATALEFVRDEPADGGEEFVHPDAIGDWEILEVREAGSGDYSSETAVAVTIGNDDGTAEGRFTVTEHTDDIFLKNPFQRVTFGSSAQQEIRVGDRIVERGGEAVDGSYLPQEETFSLLPGIYSFFDGEPAALMDQDADSDPALVTPPPPEPTQQQLEAIQAETIERIDECVEYRTLAPPECPFATDGEIDTVDRERLRNVDELTWTVVEYPEATVRPDIDEAGQEQLYLDFTEPGRLELTGTGTVDNDEWEPFEAACHFGGNALAVSLSGDDGVRLETTAEEAGDTCRGTE